MARLRLLLTLFISLSIAQAATSLKPFDQKAFEADMAANKTIVLHFYANWCGTCELQHPVIEKLANEKASSQNIVFYQVNVDGAQDEQSLTQEFRVRNGFIVVLEGKQKKDTLASEVDPKTIEDFIQRNISPS